MSELISDNRKSLLIYFPSEGFLKKLGGRSDIEDALQRLDKLTREEHRMAAAQDLFATQHVAERVASIENDLQQVFQQMTIDISDQKRGLSHISPILIVGAQILLQRTFQDGSRPRTHLLITILQAVHVTRTLGYGSFKAAPSITGRSLLHCCGYTENVHVPAAVSSPLLTYICVHSRCW